MSPLQTLRHHVTGAIERGEATAIVEQRAEITQQDGQYIADSPTVNDLAKAQEYAQLRANETGRPYIVSNYARVLVDCPHNRRVLHEELLEPIHQVRTPDQWL